MKNTINKVIRWAEDKNIFSESSPLSQHDKLIEEVIETRDAIIDYEGTELFLNGICISPESENRLEHLQKDNMEEIKDGIGDCVVCLINLAHFYGLDIQDCLDHAYDQIKDRKGKMINGKFVKEETN